MRYSLGNNKLCPVKALQRWGEVSEENDGYVFTAVKKGQNKNDASLTPQMVSHILKKRCKECGFPNPENFSGHSTRRGFATVAVKQWASLNSIMRQGRWRNVATVNGYIEEGTMFEANAAGMLLNTVKGILQ